MSIFRRGAQNHREVNADRVADQGGGGRSPTPGQEIKKCIVCIKIRNPGENASALSDSDMPVIKHSSLLRHSIPTARLPPIPVPWPLPKQEVQEEKPKKS